MAHQYFKSEASQGGMEMGFFILTPAAFSTQEIFLPGTLKNLSQTVGH